jgi:hypothetical protein
MACGGAGWVAGWLASKNIWREERELGLGGGVVIDGVKK